MARKVAELLENKDVYEVEPLPTPLEDADTESAWDAWQEDLKTSGTGGKVRVYKVPSDDEGNPRTNAKGAQLTYLGAWEHQQYGFDEMCAMLTQKFLAPGETCYVRMIGLRAGARGIQFNRYVQLQRDATDSAANAPQTQFDSVVRAMQETQKQTAEMVQRLAAPAHVPVIESRSMISPELKEVLIACIPVMGTIVGALIQRPKPQSDMATLIEAMGKMKEFISGESSTGNDDSTVSIVKAVAPGALQLLATLTANSRQAVPPRAPRRLPAPGTVPTRIAPPQPIPAPQPTPAPIPTPQPLENDPMLAQLQPQLETLAQIAETNADPAEVAKLVLDSVPETFDEKLWELISDPMRFNRLFILVPKLNTHKEWMEKLRVALVAEYTDEAPAPTPEVQP